jgi:hypothetical protein
MTDNIHPGLLEPDDWQEAAVQAPLALAALGFLRAVVLDNDLPAAWDLAHDRLRTSWAAAWVKANATSLARDAHDLQAVESDLAGGRHEHDLWIHFARVVIRDVSSLVPAAPEHWGIGATARVVGLDLELLYLHDTGGRTDMVWNPGETKPVVPVLMSHTDGAWKVLNLGSETIPE